MQNFKHCQRIAIKAGTSILTSARGKFSQKKLEQLGSEILQLTKNHKKTVLVSSGAVGLGMEVHGFKSRPQKMPVIQACAAIGQGKLMHAYERFFSKRGMHTGQVLLTRDGLENRDRFLKARKTLEELLRMKVLPIVNENDTVSTDEIKFGDNDILSVQVAQLVNADLLIILSDVDGFYLKDGTRVRRVFSESEIDTELVKHIHDKVTNKTVGGMRSKLAAAKIAMNLGIPLMIVNGHEAGIVQKVIEGEDVGTLFMPGGSNRSSRKKWIAFSAARKGSIVIDQGAQKAIHNEKRSLLASGILKAKGQFDRKEIVEIEASDGKVLGRGLTRYSNQELSKILGKKSGEIQKALGYKHGDEVIHRNDLVMWG